MSGSRVIKPGYDSRFLMHESSQSIMRDSLIQLKKEKKEIDDLVQKSKGSSNNNKQND